MVTFVQETYALVKFVEMSNISAVTGPTLTKISGHNILGVKIFVDQNVLGQNFFEPNFFILGPIFLKKFWTRNFFPSTDFLVFNFFVY